MKPSIPQGTRDFNADTLRKRNYIFQTIKNVFELYGFQPLETPAMENLETLTGKYGDEGDQLLFKILNNGLNRPEKQTQAEKDFEEILHGKNVISITERALRYDLTIPFARYVAMNYGQLNFPFKRYQIQPVWRADRPQKGRYREFYQCDADIVGSNSLLNEVELVNIYIEVLTRLKIDFTIKVNHRKVLEGINSLIGKPITTKVLAAIIDKLDKIGIENISNQFIELGLNDEQLSSIKKFLTLADENPSVHYYASLFLDSEIGRKGISDINFVISHVSNENKNKILFSSSLARGLDYYTGCIFEVIANNVQIGSIGGGGRYDDLTGLFDVPNVPGVGISLGVDRIYDVMQELKLFPSNMNISTQVLFFNLGEEESKVAYDLMQQLRSNNISCEIYHEKSKFDKQFKYAERKNILYTAIIGNNEIENKTCIIKNIKTGVQNTIHQTEILEYSFL